MLAACYKSAIKLPAISVVVHHQMVAVLQQTGDICLDKYCSTRSTELRLIFKLNLLSCL